VNCEEYLKVLLMRYYVCYHVISVYDVYIVRTVDSCAAELAHKGMPFSMLLFLSLPLSIVYVIQSQILILNSSSILVQNDRS
jgi:hypothetical protein